MKRIGNTKLEPTPKQRRKQKPRSAPKPSYKEEVKALCMDIRYQREERGLTLEEFSEMTSLSPNFIGSVELGRRDPSISTIKALANGMSIPMSELLGPMKPLSPTAMNVARMFRHAPEDLQVALLRLLHATVDKPHR